MNGTLLLMAGGGPGRRVSYETILEGFFAQLGRSRPSVAYLGSACDDNVDFFHWAKDMLVAAGAGEVIQVRTVIRRSRRDKILSDLEKSDAVFVSGGDVEAGMDVIGRLSLIEPLRLMHRAGKPFLGVSAGAIMLGRRWVRWHNPRDDKTARLFDCLGLAPFVCDTHAESDDWIELHTALRLCEAGEIGYGITAGAAILVRADGRLEPMGGSVQRLAHQRERIVILDPLSPFESLPEKSNQMG